MLPNYQTPKLSPAISRIFAFQLRIKNSKLRTLRTRGSTTIIAANIRKDRLACQAPRLHFSIIGNLWRLEWLLGLRSAWNRNAPQCQRSLVACHDASPRYRRLGCCDLDASQGMGSLRPCAEFFRSDGRLQIVQSKIQA